MITSVLFYFQIRGENVSGDIMVFNTSIAERSSN